MRTPTRPPLQSYKVRVIFDCNLSLRADNMHFYAYEHSSLAHNPIQILHLIMI
jgi:hypothetical protein